MRFKRLKMTLITIISLTIFSIIGINLFIGLHPTFGAKKQHKNPNIDQSKNFNNGIFVNQEETKMMTGQGNMFQTMKKYFRGVENDKPKDPVLSDKFNPKEFTKNDSSYLYTWFGHSTVLLNINGKTIITDPVFSKAASPVSFFNKAFNFENSYTVEDLPNIDIVLISHDHYDHLDYKTIKEIDSKTKLFIVPLGVDGHLKRWGISESKIKIADWGDSIKFDDIEFISTPARHFSGRGTKDRDNTLWCSWVINDGVKKVYFGGDSGYGKHFKEIGDKYGPIDLTLIECGQYNENWAHIHAMPEQTIQAHIDLNGKKMLPIHWSKFKLSIHSWKEPIERAQKEADKLDADIQRIKIGSINEI